MKKGVIDKLIKTIERLDGWSSDYPWFSVSSASIHFYHAKEGVKQNGVGRTISYYDSMKDLNEVASSLEETKSRIDKSLEEIKSFKLLFDKSHQLCPNCCGSFGFGKSHESTWEDCFKCDGKGFIDLPTGDK